MVNQCIGFTITRIHFRKSSLISWNVTLLDLDQNITVLGWGGTGRKINKNPFFSWFILVNLYRQFNIDLYEFRYWVHRDYTFSYRLFHTESRISSHGGSVKFIIVEISCFDSKHSTTKIHSVGEHTFFRQGRV